MGKLIKISIVFNSIGKYFEIQNPSIHLKENEILS